MAYTYRAVILVTLICIFTSCGAATPRDTDRQIQDDECPRCSPGPDLPTGEFDYYVLQKYAYLCSVLETLLRLAVDTAMPTMHVGSRRLPSGTLHGLWPQLCNSCPKDFPYTCTSERFDVDSIPDETYQKMLTDWPSDRGGKYLPLCKSAWCLNAAPLTHTCGCAHDFSTAADDFFNHEYTCHGTCSGLKQGEYFTAAIQAYENCNAGPGVGSSILSQQLSGLFMPFAWNGYGGHELPLLRFLTGADGACPACRGVAATQRTSSWWNVMKRASMRTIR